MTKQLTASRLNISELSESQILEMFSLMKNYYNHVNLSEFKNDLLEKDILIILKDDSNHIQGFSSQKIFPFSFRNQILRIVFSGDTVIDKKFRGSLELPIAWGKFMLEIESNFKEEAVYWMLITKGIRTFRYLPVFFYEFYPNPFTEIPEFISELSYALGLFKFGNKYDGISGIIRAGEESQSIKELMEDEEFIMNRSFDPYIDFFKNRNPRFGKGDELLCIARFNTENLRPFIVRALRKENKI